MEPDEKKTNKMAVVPFGKDAGKTHAVLITVGGPATVGAMFKVEGEMVIGRGSEVEITLDDPDVSRRHAKVTRHPDGKVELEDLESTNGTFCNSLRVRHCILRDGDHIRIGPSSLMKFSQLGAQEEALQQHLFDQATRDGLTRAYTRRFFDETMRKEFAYASRHATPLCLLLLDLDHFKSINDQHGHIAGDYVLKHLAAQIHSSIRTEDIFARYGGEEFALVLRDTTQQVGSQCAERLRKKIEATVFEFSGQRIPVTISIGVATLTGGNLANPEALIQAADRKLYQAKEKGRNRVEP